MDPESGMKCVAVSRGRRRRLLLGLASAGALGFGGCAEVPVARDAGRPQVLVFPPPPDEPRFVFERSLYSSSDVTAKDRSSALRQMLTGEGERAGEGVLKPYGVAARRGRIYVADSVGGALRVFDVPGQKFLSIGTEEPGQLLQPLGVDTDAAGNIYVVDATAKMVKAYGPDGKFLRQFGGRNALVRPTGVAVDAAGERAYVVDTGGVDKQDAHRVRVYDPRTGAHLFDFGTRGNGPGEFNLARDVAVSANREVYVVDGGNFRVQVFDRDGKYLRAFGQVGRQPGNFARPREVAIDREGRVYVSDAAFGNFQIFDANGGLLMHVGDRAERDAPARYMLPAGIAVDEDGRVYMADQYFRKVDVYRPYAMRPDQGFVAPSATARESK
jgi:DNA-binding beta-propeller fold protein YncE